MTRTLVIGRCGFIGSHILDSLLAKGHRVRVLDMKPEAFRPPLPGVEYVHGSFTDPQVLALALRQVDVVIHTASTTVPATSNLDPVGDIEGNLISTVRLLHEMRANGVRKLRDFIDVRDLADLTSLAAESSISGCFNAGSGEGASVNRIVELTGQITGRELQPIYKPGRGFDVPRIVLDIGRIRSALDWSPRVPLDQGIRDTWDWMLRSKQVSAAA